MTHDDFLWNHYFEESDDLDNYYEEERQKEKYYEQIKLNCDDEVKKYTP